MVDRTGANVELIIIGDIKGAAEVGFSTDGRRVDTVGAGIVDGIGVGNSDGRIVGKRDGP